MHVRVLRVALISLISGHLALAAAAASGSDLPLIEAIRNNQTARAADLVRQGADVNLAQPDGTTALHFAVEHDDLSTANLLLRAGAKVNAANEYGVTAAFLAATNGSASMLKALVAAGAEVNAALPTGETVLMAAARTGRTDAVQVLLDRGADVTAAQASKGQTALMWACAEGHVATVRLLLEYGAPATARSSSGFTALLFAARQGSLDASRLLLQYGADVNESAADGSTPLLVATVRGHVALASDFLARGAQPDGNAAVAGYTPLHWASGLFESITSHDYPVESGEWTALAGISNRAGKLSLINALLDRGADVEARVTKDPPRYGFTLFRRNYIFGGTPYYLAAQAADLEVMQLLAKRGADTRATARDKTTPLMVAAGITHNNETRITEKERLAAVKLALELGSDVDALNNASQSAVWAAAYANFGEVIELLAQHGANLNQKSGTQTPLGMAEGAYFDGSIVERPAAVAALRKLGATSEGRQMKDAALGSPRPVAAPPPAAATPKSPENGKER